MFLVTKTAGNFFAVGKMIDDVVVRARIDDQRLVALLYELTSETQTAQPTIGAGWGGVLADVPNCLLLNHIILLAVTSGPLA